MIATPPTELPIWNRNSAQLCRALSVLLLTALAPWSHPPRKHQKQSTAKPLQPLQQQSRLSQPLTVDVLLSLTCAHNSNGARDMLLARTDSRSRTTPLLRIKCLLLPTATLATRCTCTAAPAIALGKLRKF